MPRAIDAKIRCRIDGDAPRVNAQDRFAALEIGIADRDLAIEPARAQERRIENIGTVGGGDDDDAAMRFETVHFDEQLIERLLTLFVAE